MILRNSTICRAVVTRRNAYGAHRDDVKRTHPCLVPYESLSESEKDYDRIMVNEALKAIIAMGYRITKR